MVGSLERQANIVRWRKTHASTVMGREPTLIKTIPRCRAGLTGSNPVLTTMKQLIKQSIIGALYMFAITSFMAVLVIALYTMAGR